MVYHHKTVNIRIPPPPLVEQKTRRQISRLPADFAFLICYFSLSSDE